MPVAAHDDGQTTTAPTLIDKIELALSAHHDLAET